MEERSAIEQLLLSLHDKLDREQEAQRMQRGLEVITDMVQGMSYLLLGLSIPMVSSTATQALQDFSLVMVLPCVFTVFLVLFGIRLLKAALSAKAYFLDNPHHLPDFLAVFQKSEVFGVEFRAWLRRPEISTTPLAKDLRRVGQAFQVGWFTAVILGVTMLVTYFAAIFLLLSNTLGIVISASVMVGLTLAYAAALWVAVRTAMRKPGKLPEPPHGTSQGPSRNPLEPELPGAGDTVMSENS